MTSPGGGDAHADGVREGGDGDLHAVRPAGHQRRRVRGPAERDAAEPVAASRGDHHQPARPVEDVEDRVRDGELADGVHRGLEALVRRREVLGAPAEPVRAVERRVHQRRELEVAGEHARGGENHDGGDLVRVDHLVGIAVRTGRGISIRSPCRRRS